MEEGHPQRHCKHFAVYHEDAGFLDLARLLIYADVSERQCIECSDEYKEELRGFRHRWIIFLSIVAQKLLRLIRGLLKCIGDMVEGFLNLLLCNGGLLKLIMNALRGKVVCPDRNSKTFVSVVGSLDTRVELDSHLKHGDAEYNAHLSMMAAKLSYENKPFVETTVKGRWKMEHLLCKDFQNAASDPPKCHNQKQPSTRATKSHNKEKPLTRAIMFKDQELIVVAFRGTRPFDADAWSTDIDISWYELKIEGKEEPVRIHGGFMKALGLQEDEGRLKESDEIQEDKSYAYYEIKKKLRNLLSDERNRFIVTGHSLGGALAILFVGALCIQKEDAILKKLEGVYTLGNQGWGMRNLGTT